MAQSRREIQLRGSITAAAAVLGVQLEIVEGHDWVVAGGSVRLGVKSLIQDTADNGHGDGNDEAVAHTLLLLWESVREARVAPLRRARRLALSRLKPELEPMLATIDRVLAASELIAAMPYLRMSVHLALLATLPESPRELPKHLQWLSLLLSSVTDTHSLAKQLDAVEPLVRTEFIQLSRGVDAGSGLTAAQRVIRLAFNAAPTINAMRRFERAYALVAPPYLSLLTEDLQSSGLDSGHTGRVDNDEAEAQDEGIGSSGGGDTNEAKPGGDAEDAASDGAAEAARAGDSREVAEGADLFAAEQAGFVETVLDTPLPAHGAWTDGLAPPESEATGVHQHPRNESLGSKSGGSKTVTSLEEYRERTRELASAIDELRDVWRKIIAERVGVRSEITRHPEPDGEVLDRNSLVRIVSEVIAGVERPNAFLSRRPILRRTRNEGSTDYVLLIDRSASMRGAPADGAADAALVMLESLAAVSRDIAAEERTHGLDLDLSLRTSMIVYDSEPTVVKPLSGALDDTVRRRLHAEIRSPRGSTNDASALEAAAQELGNGGFGHTGSSGVRDGATRRRVVIVISDGGTDDGGAAARRVQQLRALGIAVFGVGIRTDDLTTRFAPDGIRLDDPAKLAAAIGRLVARSGLDAVLS
ncbi:MAG: vWA domain-containing protein [Leucobacter sp.]